MQYKEIGGTRYYNLNPKKYKRWAVSDTYWAIVGAVAVALFVFAGFCSMYNICVAFLHI